MATATRHRSSAGAEREHHRTNLWAQLARFVGLFLSPLIGLLGAWLIHVWAAGVHLHWGPINWDANTPRGMSTIVAILLALVVVWIARQAWEFTEHRKESLRRALTISVMVIGVMFAFGVGVGPSYVWSGLFFIAAWVVAVLWSIARLDVTRNDKQADDGQKEEGFLEKHGLKGWKVRKVVPVTDDKGQPLASEVHFQSAEGGTVDQLQDAVPAFESATASPRSMSRATGTDRADQSVLTIMHRDPLFERQPLPPPSSPGGSVADGAMIGTYANGMKVTVYLGGPRPEVAGRAKTGADYVDAPSNYVIMGVARAGKTYGENELITENATRRDVVFLYMNKSKGMQDMRPICPSLEVAVVEEDGDEGGKYRQAMTNIEKIMRYRQSDLGLFGISAWSADSCFHNPPWRTDETGKRVRMEPKPLLWVHLGEADSIIVSEGRRATTITSKCLSLGIIIGYSLQRPDYQQMPTGLRFNLGTAICFGTSDDVSAGFALSDATVKAGAKPENWGQRKPGYFYVEGLGIDDEMFPVPARTFSDETKEILIEKLLRRNLEWGPRMAKLDAGSVAATDYDGGNWWTEMAANTERLRAKLLGQPATTSATSPANPTATSPATRTDEEDEYTAELRKLRAEAPQVADDDTDEADEYDAEDFRKEMEDEVRNATHVEGVELYPRDPETGDRATMADATRDLPKADPADHVSWGDERPAPRDRQAALDMVVKVLGFFMADDSRRDPADTSGNTVILTVGEIFNEYGKEFRSRPWFSDIVNDAADGATEIAGYSLTRAPDLGPALAKYRLTRIGI